MIIDIPESAEAVFIFAHGAGAGMDHPFMQLFTDRLNNYNIGTVRFNFPYMEKGRKAPGSQREAVETIAGINSEIVKGYNKLPILAGGKSYGGRMASIAASEGRLNGVSGLIFLGFPLHAPGKPSVKRAAHLYTLKSPMLFLQGERDKLSEIQLIEEVASDLPYATLNKYPEADHSFKVRKRSEIDQEELYECIAQDISSWVSDLKSSVHK